MTNSLNLRGDLDDVEAVTWTERTFGISISNEEAEATLTVGQLYDLVEAKCGDEPTEVCLSQLAFYRLRTAMRELGVTSEIVPTTPISVVEPAGGSIRRVWKRLSVASGLRLPRLETPFTGTPPIWVDWLAAIGAAAAFVAGFHVTKGSGLFVAVALIGSTVVVGLAGLSGTLYSAQFRAVSGPSATLRVRLRVTVFPGCRNGGAQVTQIAGTHSWPCCGIFPDTSRRSRARRRSFRAEATPSGTPRRA